MPASIPPYITSGASSRAHHAFIVSLNEARSPQEEASLVRNEVQRAKEVLSTTHSTSKIAETLIILQHCEMINPLPVGPSDSSMTMEFALMPALQLAEGGKTLKERRIGYQFLRERLPLGHDLQLMLVNTIRKDLSSETPQEVILALHTIIALPSCDLRPAVEPLLVHKTLLKNRLPSIRQKTLNALTALYFAQDLGRTVGPKSFPLTLPKLIRLLSSETDPSVALSLLRSTRTVISEKAHKIQSEDERLFLVETAIAQAKRAEAGGQMKLDVLQTIQELLKGAQGRASNLATAWITSTLKRQSESTFWHTAYLLEVASYISKSGEESTPALIPIVIKGISALLRSGHRSVPNPNDHVVALQCLSILPPTSWDGSLGEVEMRMIMEGVNSPDDTTRLLTFSLLYKLAPQLLTSALKNHLESLATSTNLALPLGLDPGLEQERKIRAGREETALRALEVVLVKAKAVRDGAVLANGVAQISAAYCKVEGSRIWEVGLRRVLDTLRDANNVFRRVFVRALFSAETGDDQTIAVLRATTGTDYGPFVADDISHAVAVLLNGIEGYPASVQELLLVAAVGILARVPRDEAAVVQVEGGVENVRSHGVFSKYMETRCSQIEKVVADQSLLSQLEAHRSLTDLLPAIIHLGNPKSEQSTPTTPQTSRPRNLATSVLRYDAYEMASPPKPYHRSPSVQRKGARFGSRGQESLTAGEYALFDADNEEEEEPSVTSGLLDRRVNNLVGLSLDGDREERTKSPSYNDYYDQSR